jgi:hypothetical protein
MTWIYIQSTGELFHNGAPIAVGYSGKGPGKNDVEYQAIHNMGPIPRGEYRIGDPHDSNEHGPFVLPLAPSMDNRMHGRSGFACHGERKSGPPGMASTGCIVLPRIVRNQIAASRDRELKVVTVEEAAALFHEIHDKDA